MSDFLNSGQLVNINETRQVISDKHHYLILSHSHVCVALESFVEGTSEKKKISKEDWVISP